MSPTGVAYGQIWRILTMKPSVTRLSTRNFIEKKVVLENKYLGDVNRLNTCIP